MSNFKIEFGGRATGKTTRMLRELHNKKDVILLTYKQEVGDHLVEYAKSLGINIVNRPLSYNNKSDFIRAQCKKVYVDDGDVLFRKMFEEMGLDVEKVNFRIGIGADY